MNIEPLETRIAPATIVVNALTDVVDADDDDLTLREAINAANADANADTIKFDPALDSSDPADGVLTLTSGEILISETLTILGGGKITISGNEASRIFRVENPDTEKAHPLTVNGLRFTLGKVTGSGGAINSSEGLTIIGCLFDDNEATFGGGAVFSTSGTTTVKDSHFTDNVGGTVGGALFVNTSTPLTIAGSVFDGNTAASAGAVRIDAPHIKASVSITGSIFSHNTASTQSSGALSISGLTGIKAATKITIAKSQFVENEAAFGGGGAGIGGGALTLSEVLVSGNVAGLSAGGVGAGGLQKLTVTKSVFTGNSADGTDGGGGMYLTNGADGFSATFTASKFVENEATNGPGGGLRVNGTDGKLTITGSQFSGNVAGTFAGGLSASETAETASASLTGNSFTGNEAVDYGGLNVRYDGGAVALKNNLVAGNEASSGIGGANLVAGTTLTLSGNTIAGNRAAILSGGLFLGVTGMGGTFSLSGDRIMHNEVTGNGAAGVLIGSGAAGVSGTIGKTVRISGNITDTGTGGVETDTPGVTLLAVVTGNLVRNNPANPQTDGTFANTPPTAPAIAADFIVIDDGDLGPGTLREAIENAEAGDTIAFAPAVTSITLASALEVTETLTILGRGLVTISGNNNTRLFDVSNPDDTKDHPLTLNGLILINGKVTGMFNPGGAILSTEGLNLIGCLLLDHSAGAGGGAVSLTTTTGALTITDSHFAGNSAVLGGGGVFAEVAKTIAISGSTFHDNSGNSGGGAFLRLAAATGKLTLSGSLFTENGASAGVGGGAAIDGTLAGTKFAKFSVTNSTFLRNGASTDGGGLNLTDGGFTLTGVNLSRNAASAEGGGLATGAGLRTLSIAKSLIARNVAATLGGGGVFLAQGEAEYAATVSATAFLGNGTTGMNGVGGGLLADSTAGKLTVTASLFAGNSATTGGGLAATGTGSNAPIVALTGNAFVGNIAVTGGGVSLLSDAALTLGKNVIVANDATTEAGGARLESKGKIALSGNSILGNRADTGVGGLLLRGINTPGMVTTSFTTAGDVIAFNEGATGGLEIEEAIAGIIAKSVKITGNVGTGALNAGGITQESANTNGIELFAIVLGNLHRTDPAKNETFGLFAP